MEIKYLGHSCFLVDFGGKNLLFDPFITPNPKANAIDIGDIQVDFVLLSHGHQDHCADLETIFQHNPEAKLISSFELVTYFGEKGIQGHPMNTGGSWSFDFGTVKCVHAVHSNALPDGTYGGPCMGFVLHNNEGVLYFAGDTALTMDMKLIPNICPPLKAAILPIGDNFTMGINDALLASDFIGCNKIIGCHYDTFGYIEIDHNAAISKFKQRDKELILLDIGSKISV